MSVKQFMRKYVWNPATCNCKNGKYLASIMDDSMITCDEVTKLYDGEIKTILSNFNKKKVTCKKQNFYILLAFLFITMTLLIAVSIYCYVIIRQAKYLLPFHSISN